MDLSTSILDSAALLWFLACWWGYLLYTNYINRTRKCLRCVMDHWRQNWALSILTRDPRIMDSQIINGLVSKETFFASTTILILASCIALMGLHDEVSNLLSDLPFTEPVSRTLWEIKVMVLILIFVYAFFQIQLVDSPAFLLRHPARGATSGRCGRNCGRAGPGASPCKFIESWRAQFQ